MYRVKKGISESKTQDYMQVLIGYFHTYIIYDSWKNIGF